MIATVQVLHPKNSSNCIHPHIFQSMILTFTLLPPAHVLLHLSNSPVLQENLGGFGSITTEFGTEYSYEIPGFFSPSIKRTC